MRLELILGLFTLLYATLEAGTSTQGLSDLLRRRLPSHCEEFEFILNEYEPTNSTKRPNDNFTVSIPVNGNIVVEGNSLSALAYGLYKYLSDVVKIDIYWFIGSRLEEGPSALPRSFEDGTSVEGASVVPWRYFFNTVTFSYTSPFWTWSDWEFELDWLALHGVNLPLAWVGYEKILLDVFRDIGLSDDSIISFFSGPAFQAWNRFGNIQGSWNGKLPLSWIEDQFELQKKILKRMIELGMTPILPAFTGFVPRDFAKLFPNASVINGSQWESFLAEYTNTTFLEPSDPLFGEIQMRFISKQVDHYGNITSFYTLDQYNENDPYSGELDYLRNVSRGTWQSLKDANPAAVWVMQGWLFSSNQDFWTNERIEAYLGGVEENEDMLVLDLFSESQPQWQRTDGYYGKPWMWCQLHDYGGNMGLYGQIENITVNPIQALENSSNLVGFGITPEGQEGNEIMYTLLLDQAWTRFPISTESYFVRWVNRRYAGKNSLPHSLYIAWDILRTSVYNNTNLTSNGVTKSIFELSPNSTKLTNRTGHHPTTVNYPPHLLVQAWQSFYEAANTDSSIWTNPAYQHDLVDITRQVFSNAFIPLYQTFVATWLSPPSTNHSINETDEQHRTNLETQANIILSLLTVLDKVLSTLPQFRLSTWLESARTLAGNDTTLADFYEYNARNQITLWGPDGEINDYASKSWGGLVGEYYYRRWDIWLAYLTNIESEYHNETVARNLVKEVEEAFQNPGAGKFRPLQELRPVMEEDVVPFLRKIGVVGG